MSNQSYDDFRDPQYREHLLSIRKHESQGAVDRVMQNLVSELLADPLGQKILDKVQWGFEIPTLKEFDARIQETLNLSDLSERKAAQQTIMEEFVEKT